MKTITRIFISLFLLLLGTNAPAQYARYTNFDGGVYSYNTNADGSANVAGYAGPPWVITMPSSFNGQTVETIGVAAFENDLLTNIAIAGTVNGIGQFAFGLCYGLTNVTLPASVTAIGPGAFEECRSLGSVVIPGTVTNLGADAFAACIGLTNVTIGNGITSLEGTFDACTRLAGVAIPPSVTVLGSNAFSATSLTNITLPAGVTSIGSAFADCASLGSFTIPPLVTSLDMDAFYGCTILTNLILTTNIKNIGAYALAFCPGLTNPIIPRGVTNLGSYAFQGSSNLGGIYFAGNAPAADSTVFPTQGYNIGYYLPNTTGWSNFFNATTLPVLLWNPVIQTADGKFGVRNNQFGFDITSYTNLLVVVEACTNLANPVWTRLSTNLLTNQISYFSDPQWTLYPNRFYGLGFP